MVKKKTSKSKGESLVETRKKNRPDGTSSPIAKKLKDDLESRMTQVDDWIWVATKDAYARQRDGIRESMQVREQKKRIQMQHDIINGRWNRLEEIYDAYEVFRKAYSDVLREIYKKYEYDEDVEWYMKWSGQRK